MAEKISDKPLALGQQKKNPSVVNGPPTSSAKGALNKASVNVKLEKKFSSRFILRRPSTLKTSTKNPNKKSNIPSLPSHDLKKSRTDGSRFFGRVSKTSSAKPNNNNNNSGIVSDLDQNDKSNFGTNLTMASDFIQALSNSHCLPMENLYTILKTLRIAISSNPASWSEMFGEGVNHLLFILSQMHHKKNDKRGEEIHLECLRCFKELVYKKQDRCCNEMLILHLVQSLDPSYPLVMNEILHVLSVVCFVPKGHKLMLKAFTECCNDSFQRFESIIAGLKMKNSNLAINCFKFVNSVINSPQDLDLRLHLRNEFLSVGLRDILTEIEEGVNEYDNPKFAVQIQLFYKYRDLDCDKLFIRFDNLRFQFDDVDECFELLKSSVMGSESEPLFLSILQHLLFIRDDPKIRIAYYRLIEECVSQIVIHHSGCDPDFRASRKVHIYVYPETGLLPEKAKVDDEKLEAEFSRKLEEIILEKQLFEEKISQLEQALSKYRELNWNNADSHIDDPNRIQEQPLHSNKYVSVPFLSINNGDNRGKTIEACNRIKFGKMSEKRPLSCSLLPSYPRNVPTVWIKGSNIKRDEASLEARNTKKKESSDTQEIMRPVFNASNIDKESRPVHHLSYKNAAQPSSDARKELTLTSNKVPNRNSTNVDGPHPLLPWH